MSTNKSNESEQFYDHPFRWVLLEFVHNTREHWKVVAFISLSVFFIYCYTVSKISFFYLDLNIDYFASYRDYLDVSLTILGIWYPIFLLAMVIFIVAITQFVYPKIKYDLIEHSEKAKRHFIETKDFAEKTGKIVGVDKATLGQVCILISESKEFLIQAEKTKKEVKETFLISIISPISIIITLGFMAFGEVKDYKNKYTKNNYEAILVFGQKTQRIPCVHITFNMSDSVIATKCNDDNFMLINKSNLLGLKEISKPKTK